MNKIISKIVLVNLICLLFFNIVLADTLKDTYNQTETDYYDVQLTHYTGLVYVPTSDYTVCSVEIFTDGAESTRLDLYAVDGSHKPTGSSLDNGTVTTTAGGFTLWNLGGAVSATNGTPLALVLSSTNVAGFGSQPSVSNISAVSGNYLLRSTNSGVTWTATASGDSFRYNIYGCDGGGGGTSTSTATSTINQIQNNIFFSIILFFLGIWFIMNILNYGKRK